jgi:hypothetical protein
VNPTVKHGPITLSPSSVSDFLRCPALYDVGRRWRPVGYKPAPEIGSAFGVALRAARTAGQGNGFGRALAAGERYLLAVGLGLARLLDDDGRRLTASQIATDQIKLRAMLYGYARRWRGGANMFRFLEHEFRLGPHRVINPATGAAMHRFAKVGYADAIVCFADPDKSHKAPDRKDLFGPVYVYELKTTSESLDESIRTHQRHYQTWCYQELAEQTGLDVRGTILDLVKKPIAKRRNSKKSGRETDAAWLDRMIAAYAEEPDRFFRRVELPYSQTEIRAQQRVFWHVAKSIRECERIGYVAPIGRHCAGQYGACEYRPLCWHDQLEGRFEEKATMRQIDDDAEQAALACAASSTAQEGNSDDGTEKKETAAAAAAAAEGGEQQQQG